MAFEMAGWRRPTETRLPGRHPVLQRLGKHRAQHRHDRPGRRARRAALPDHRQPLLPAVRREGLPVGAPLPAAAERPVRRPRQPHGVVDTDPVELQPGDDDRRRHAALPGHRQQRLPLPGPPDGARPRSPTSPRNGSAARSRSSPRSTSATCSTSTRSPTTRPARRSRRPTSTTRGSTCASATTCSSRGSPAVRAAAGAGRDRADLRAAVLAAEHLLLSRGGRRVASSRLSGRVPDATNLITAEGLDSAQRRAGRARGGGPAGDRRAHQDGARVGRSEGEQRVPRRQERAGAPGDEDRAAAREDRRRRWSSRRPRRRRWDGRLRLHGRRARSGWGRAHLADRQLARRRARARAACRPNLPSPWPCSAAPRAIRSRSRCPRASACSPSSASAERPDARRLAGTPRRTPRRVLDTGACLCERLPAQRACAVARSASAGASGWWDPRPPSARLRLPGAHPRGQQRQVVLLSEQFAELVRAPGAGPDVQHLGGVAQVLDAFAPLVHRAGSLARAPRHPPPSTATLAVEIARALVRARRCPAPRTGSSCSPGRAACAAQRAPALRPTIAACRAVRRARARPPVACAAPARRAGARACPGDGAPAHRASHEHLRVARARQAQADLAQRRVLAREGLASQLVLSSRSSARSALERLARLVHRVFACGTSPSSPPSSSIARSSWPSAIRRRPLAERLAAASSAKARARAGAGAWLQRRSRSALASATPTPTARPSPRRLPRAARQWSA